MADVPAPVIVPETWTGPLPLHDILAAGRPLEVDVGCGKGRFLIARAKAHPETDFLGIERLLMRLRKVAKKTTRAGLSNVYLLRIEASYAIEYLLPPLSVNTFYIFFPDPWPKRRHHKRRMFTPAFLDALHKTLRPGGRVHVATDHLGYMERIAELFGADHRFIEIPPFVPAEDEQTDFEITFLEEAKPIRRHAYSKRE